MEKIPTTQKLFLDQIAIDFTLVGDTLKQAIYYIENTSEFKFPIILVSDRPTVLGEIVIDKDELGNSLAYHATYLDFLIEKNIFSSEDAFNFKEIYSSHKDHCCMLILFEESINFLYVPYP